MDITVVGSINIDIVALTNKYPIRGETIFGDKLDYLPGGKGGNQATTCAKLGKKAGMIGSVGHDSFGNDLIETLESNGVYAEYVKQSSKNPTGTAMITIDKTAENTMLVFKGANDDLKKSDVMKATKTIEQSKVLLAQMEVPEEAVITAMSEARRHGKYVILDPAPAEGITIRALHYADVILPNRQETKYMTGIDVIDIDSALKAAEYFEQMGVERAIIKMAEKGSLVYDKGSWEHVATIPVDPVDTVGGGDSYAGALACAIADGEDIFTAAKFASIVGTLNVTRLGAQKAIPTLDEVNAFSRKHKVEHYLLKQKKAAASKK